MDYGAENMDQVDTLWVFRENLEVNFEMVVSEMRVSDIILMFIQSYIVFS